MQPFHLLHRCVLRPGLLVFLLILLAGGVRNSAQGEELRKSPSPQADEAAAKSSPDSAERELVSGRQIGDYVPTFYTRAVTGPLMNRSVCYVCRNGQRPVAMVFLRKLGADLKPLLKQLDSLVDDHRAEGLRSFGVYVSESPGEAISAVQTFSFDHKISLPLTVASTAIEEPQAQNLHAQADVTVVLYNKRRVVTRFAFRAGEIQSADVEAIAQSISQLLKAPEPAASISDSSCQ